MIYDIPQRTAEWHEVRKRHVGCSEIGSLFGVQQDFQPSHYSLHLYKSGTIPEPDVGEELRVLCGVYFEEPSLRLAAKLYRWRMLGPCYATDDTCPGLGASIDQRLEYATPDILRKLKGVGGPGVVEWKWVDWIQHKQKWINDEPPFSVLLQLQHGIAATGYQWGVVGCCIGGNEFKIYPYTRRDGIIASIRDKVSEFWRRVRNGEPPDTDDSESTSESLKLLFPEPTIYSPLDLHDNVEADELAHGFITSQEDVKQSEKIHNGYKNRIKAMMGNHEAALTDNFRIRRQKNNAIKVTERMEKYK
jgi:predicted phage-related endonuclease